MDKIFLPSKDRNFLIGKGFSFKEVIDGTQKGIIIDNFPVRPEGKFSTDNASLLILLPTGYPDVPPDMFYMIPEIRYKVNGGLPGATDHKHAFNGASWQRWSRHADGNSWRPGIDGMQAYLQRVITALNAA